MDTESRLRTRVPDTNTGPTNTTKKNKLTVEGLNDSAVSLKAVLDQDSLGIRRESIKQAWGPNKDSLSASANSSSFERRSEGVSLSDMNIRGISEENFGRAEDHIYLGDLIKLREKFEEADKDGDGTIDMEQFLLTFDKLFGLDGKNEEEIVAFFNKIDYNCDGYIDWDKFCTYMYLEFQERDDVAVNSKKVDFQLPAETLERNPHKESLCRASHFPDGAMVTCSQDGVLCFWSHDYVPKRVRKSDVGLTGKPKWITDMALCIPQNKILLTTGDHEIQFYEMLNFEPYCQLRKLESVPLRTTFWSNPKNVDECIILVGDKEGTITVIKTTNIQEAFIHWKRGPKTEGMPTYPIEKLLSERITSTTIYRWKLHSNWVSEIQYLPSLNIFASCSCDPVNSLVMGSPSGSTPVEALLQSSWHVEEDNHETTYTGRRYTLTAKHRLSGDQRVFRVPKGISTFDYCPKNNVLVTGGLDQHIRIWNPFINSKPVAFLYGQNSPVFCVRVDSKRDRIYCVGNDNTIKVWHTLDHNCLRTLIPSAHKLSVTFDYFHFNPHHSVLFMGSDQLALLRMSFSKGVRTDIIQSHLQPITAVKYSHCFNQIVTGCEGAMVKVWDIGTGKSVFEFSADMGQDVSITAMDVDKSGKRIATGGDNGQIKLWNYNNGQCVRILDKGNSMETSDIKFITLNDNKYILTVGWDRKIHLFPDIPARHVQQLLKPIDDWSSTSSRGHSEDVLCVAVGSPNLMATSSFDGEVIVWSVVSCHMLAKLKVSYSSTSLITSCSTTTEDRAVYKILFLEKRAQLSKTSATLVSSGPYGKVHFWNVYAGSEPMGVFKASQSSCISDMAVDDNNSILITADSQGHVAIFNIKSYCIRTKTSESPERLFNWRAHTQQISSVQLVDRWNMLVTGSLDGAVRVWTLQGRYIGTFGQDQKWKLGEPSTYHSSLPKDVQLNNDDSAEGVLHSDDSFHSSGNKESEDIGEVEVEDKVEFNEEVDDIVDTELRRRTSTYQEDLDEDIHSHISMKVPNCNSPEVGKRLRHLRTHSAIKKDETKTKAIYGTLPYQPLSDDSVYHIQELYSVVGT